MPAGKLVFSGMEFVKSSMCGSSVRISVWRGTSTGGSTVGGERGPDQITTAERDATELKVPADHYRASPLSGNGRG